tara:strand:+ start:2989 stop:3543 length:555 start_codon:yes stop_codon:yes gene_type:complete
LRVPDSLIGKKLRCKNENCRQPFVAQLEPIPPDPQPAPPAEFSDLPPDWQEAMEERQHEENLLERVKAHKANKNNDKYIVSNDTNEQRYPNLTKYLGIGQVVSKIVLAISCFAIVFMAFRSFIDLVHSNLPSDVLMGTQFGILLGTALGLGFVYLCFLFTMAGIEFIQVIIDIEHNTRTKQEAV